MKDTFSIIPYKERGFWQFDDKTKGLEKELFILGSEYVLEHLTQGIPGTENGFRLTFSTEYLPGSTRLTYIDNSMHGATYRVDGVELEGLPLEGWGCPTALLYFQPFPQTLWVHASCLSGPREELS